MSANDWLNDTYVKEMLSKVGERTQKNYKERFPKWLAFIGMTPTEQFKKRCKDLQSDNPKERGFFEDKVVEYKNAMVAQNRKAGYIHDMITPVRTFFSTHRVPLRFKKGELDVDARPEDKVVSEWIPENPEAKQIYQHGDTRDRALFLCLYQSGFSETDVSSLSLEDVPDIRTHDGHYQITMHREKTDVLQRTCLSEEAVHDIKEMLNEREHAGMLKPDKNDRTPLFISQKGERLTVRFINDAIKGMVEKTYGKEKAEQFKTKSLRDAYNDALLNLEHPLTQEVKDTLFGHKRDGAREHYAISKATIINAYNMIFHNLSVNHGTQARKDIEVMRDQMRDMRDNSDKTLANLNKIIEQQQKQMETQQKLIEDQKRLTEETNRKFDAYITEAENKSMFQSQINEIYFDFGYDPDTDTQLSNKEVEKNPDARKRILSVIEDYASLFSKEAVRQWKEYLLHPEKRGCMGVRHWRTYFHDFPM
jgi:site-specific recombinase XerD